MDSTSPKDHAQAADPSEDAVTNVQQTPASDENQADDAEAQMRRALGLMGETPIRDGSPVAPTKRLSLRPRSPDIMSGDRSARRFVRDGEVPVTVVRPRWNQAAGKDAPVTNHLAVAEAAAQTERQGRERAERALQDSANTIQNLQTKQAHIELSRNEALAALKDSAAALESLHETLRSHQEQLAAMEAAVKAGDQAVRESSAALKAAQSARLAEQSARIAAEEALAEALAAPPVVPPARERVTRPPARKTTERKTGERKVTARKVGRPRVARQSAARKSAAKARTKAVTPAPKKTARAAKATRKLAAPAKATRRVKQAPTKRAVTSVRKTAATRKRRS
jgi:hypothetical protein